MSIIRYMRLYCKSQAKYWSQGRLLCESDVYIETIKISKSDVHCLIQSMIYSQLIVDFHWVNQQMTKENFSSTFYIIPDYFWDVFEEVESVIVQVLCLKIKIMFNTNKLEKKPSMTVAPLVLHHLPLGYSLLNLE